MSDSKPLSQQFQDEINEVIKKYCDQGITNCEAIGVLEIIKIDLWESLQERAEETHAR